MTEVRFTGRDHVKGYLALFTVIVMGISTGIFLDTSPIARAQSAGTVCIADTSSAACPITPTPLTGGFGSQIQIAVNVQNSDSFNTFDISVETDLAILYPVSVDLTGSLVHEPRSIATVCVNNVPVQGNCRTGIDGPGIVTVALAAAGYEVVGPASGRLFSIAYDVVGTGFDSPVGFRTGCVNSSNDDFCVTIADSTTGLRVPENLQSTSFNTLGDFALLSDVSGQSASKGSTVSFTIIATSFGDYAGTISLAATVSPATRTPPKLSLSPTSVALTPGSSSTVLLRVSLPRSITVTTYTITVTGTDGVLTNFVFVTLFVKK